MSDARTQLLDRLLASRQFAHAESLKRILRYICENSQAPNSPPIRESDIAVNAIGRPESFDPKTDPIVRVSIASIRQRLRSYFETEGQHSSVRLEIPKGHYRAVYTEAQDHTGRDGEIASAVMRFWSPYLTASAVNSLIYTELLFWRDDQGTYIRNLFVNDLTGGPAALQQKLPGIDVSALQPSYHFLSAGEVHCLLFINRVFHEVGARIEMRNARFSSWNELRQSNLILIGGSRTNKFVDALQGEHCFWIGPDRIKNRQPKHGEQSEYIARRYLDGKLERVTEYALITRQPGLSRDIAVTMISANHGRAIEAAGFFLTQEDALQGLFQNMNLDSDAPMPAGFQILLQVDLIDFDEDVVNVEYITHRIF